MKKMKNVIKNFLKKIKYISQNTMIFFVNIINYYKMILSVKNMKVIKL